MQVQVGLLSLIAPSMSSSYTPRRVRHTTSNLTVTSFTRQVPLSPASFPLWQYHRRPNGVIDTKEETIPLVTVARARHTVTGKISQSEARAQANYTLTGTQCCVG